MKKKILMILVSLLFFVTLWAQNPTKDFPYYYSDNPQTSYSDYKRCTNGELIVKDFEGDAFSGSYFQSANHHCFVFLYNKNKNDIQKAAVDFLGNYRSLFKNFDNEIDKDNGTNLRLTIVFVNADQNAVASAIYDENIESTDKSVVNPFNGVKRGLNKARETSKKRNKK